MSENKFVTIEISDSILVGCLDLISIFGGDIEIENATVNHIVSKVLEGIVLGIRDDNIIPTYEGPPEIKSRLNSFSFSDFVEKQAENMTKAVTDKMEEASDLSKVERTLEEPKEEALEENESSGEVILNFSDIPEDDPIKLEAKGSARKQKLLIDLYMGIPRELWGKEKALSMWKERLALSEKKD